MDASAATAARTQVDDRPAPMTLPGCGRRGVRAPLTYARSRPLQPPRTRGSRAIAPEAARTAKDVPARRIAEVRGGGYLRALLLRQSSALREDRRIQPDQRLPNSDLRRPRERPGRQKGARTFYTRVQAPALAARERSSEEHRGRGELGTLRFSCARARCASDLGAPCRGNGHPAVPTALEQSRAGIRNSRTRQRTPRAAAITLGLAAPRACVCREAQAERISNSGIST